MMAETLLSDRRVDTEPCLRRAAMERGMRAFFDEIAMRWIGRLAAASAIPKAAGCGIGGAGRGRTRSCPRPESPRTVSTLRPWQRQSATLFRKARLISARARRSSMPRRPDNAAGSHQLFFSAPRRRPRRSSAYRDGMSALKSPAPAVPPPRHPQPRSRHGRRQALRQHRCRQSRPGRTAMACVRRIPLQHVGQ